MKFHFTFLCLLATTFLFSTNNPKPKEKPTKVTHRFIASKAAVSSAHPEATKIGVRILKKGGNAVDASIAIQMALAVCYPRAGNLGGGGFMVYRNAKGEVVTLDYREKAPGKATRDMYLDKDGNVSKRSTDGPSAAGVPGSVDGMFQSHQYAKLPWKDLVQPAIDLAEKGWVLTEKDAETLNRFQKDFKENNTTMPVFVKDKGWKKGDRLIQKDLAATLKRIRDNGREGFYSGETAKLIIAEMKKGGGYISLEDLQQYKTRKMTPIEFDYKGYHVISMAPPASGGICLLQLMKMVEPFDLGKMGFHSPEAVHLMSEAERRVYADRSEHLGDPDFYKIPKFLQNPDYLRQRMADYDAQKATKSANIKAGSWPTESEQTTHLSVVDADGGAVSLTTTLNDNFGCKTVVAGAGFVLNNEMDDFSSKPGVPNYYGLIGAEANAIQPGKTMLSSMTPTIVLKNNKLHLVVGTPGGATIITSVFQTIINVLEYKMTLEKAIKAPRFHHQWLPDKIQYEEGGLPDATIAKLKQMGHELSTRKVIGLVDAILVQPDGKLEAVGDYRGDDTAGGY